MNNNNNIIPNSVPPCVQRIAHGGTIIIINPDVPAWIVTNQVGETVLSLFDGTNSLADIITIATEGLGKENTERVAEFCNNVMQSGILMQRPKPEPHPYLLSNVHLSLSEKCNLRCHYCYAAERDEHGDAPLTLDEYKEIIDAVRRINPDAAFTITGGEPLLNPLWLPIAEYIHEGGNFIYLLTNGTLISEQNIADIKRIAGLVTISIDGSSETIHSLNRGKGNYNRVMQGIEFLRAHQVNYSLSMTVTRHNISDVAEMAKRYGSLLNFAPLFPVSDVCDNDLSITGEQYYTALNEADSVTPLGGCENALRTAARGNRCHKCAIGDGEISISPTGDVYPCQLLHVPEMLAGNVRTTPLEDLYANSTILRQCRELSVDNIEGCKDCAVRYVCGGACRARAYYEHGSITTSGTFCQGYEYPAYISNIHRLCSRNQLTD